MRKRAAPRHGSNPAAVVTSDEQKDLSQMLQMSKSNSRALNIYNARRRGMSLIQIARQYGVSWQYVHQLELRGRRIANDIETKNGADALVACDCEPSPGAAASPI
jgi:hypothetical protein